jgi:hypothetical protein
MGNVKGQQGVVMRMLFGLLLGIIIGASGMLWFYAHGGRIIFAGRDLGSPMRATFASYASTCDANEKCVAPDFGAEVTEPPKLGTLRAPNPAKDGTNVARSSWPVIYGPNSPASNSGSNSSQALGFEGFGPLGGSNAKRVSGSVNDVTSPNGMSWPPQPSGFSPSQKPQN